MTVRVGPNETYPTHHLSLTDGIDTLGLILSNGRQIDARGIKMSGYPRSVTRISQGVSGYSDFELPYSPMQQSDFSGGMGNEDFEKDTTRFYESLNADTTKGDVIIGPKPIDAEVDVPYYKSGASHLNTSVICDAAHEYYASRFTAPGSYNLERIKVLLDSYSGPSTPITVNIQVWTHNTGTGLPDVMLAYDNVTKALSLDDDYTEYEVILDTPVALTSGTSYWIAVSASDSAKIIKVYPETASTVVYQDGVGVWHSYGSGPLWFELVFSGSGATPKDGIFFEYRGSLYCVGIPQGETTPILIQNGIHGMAQSGSTTTVIVTNKDLSDYNLVGGMLRIVAGPGSAESINYREIVSHTITGTNDTITVEYAFSQTPTTASEFAVTGVNQWETIASHGLTAKPTDAIVVDDMVFIAQGESVTIRRGKMTTGTWAWYFDGASSSVGSKATFLKYIPDTQGKFRVWRALAQASSVSYAAKPTWAASNSAILTWKTDVVCGSLDSKITGVEEYGSPLTLYVLKEDGFGSMGGTTESKVGVYAQHPLSAQIRAVRSELNGRAHMRYDLFLMFTLLDGLESHYDQRIDDIGPNRDEGLGNLSGPITDLIPYAGRYYALINSGYPTVLCCTREGSWHVVSRNTTDYGGSRMFIQVIPGGAVDRLWIMSDTKIFYLPIALNPRRDSSYRYNASASITTSWVYGGFKDVKKYFHEVTLFGENLDTTHRYVAMEYRLDDTETWTTISTHFTEGPSQTIRLSATNDVVGRRIQLRFTMYTDDDTRTPRIKAFRLDAVIRLKPKKMWNITYLVTDGQLDLQGDTISAMTIAGVSYEYTPENALALLSRWADSDTVAKPLTMRYGRDLHDNQLVFIEPTSISPLSIIASPDDNRQDLYTGSFSLLQA